jgi:hypothetical protein
MNKEQEYSRERVYQGGSHRLIPHKYALAKDAGFIFRRLKVDSSDAADFRTIVFGTDDAVIAEWDRNTHFTSYEQVHGVPYAAIINSAFAYTGKFGGRFNTPVRGAWYAALSLRVAQSEVAFHRRQFLKEQRITEVVEEVYQEYLADFDAYFVVVDSPGYDSLMLPEPVPECYKPGQQFAERLLKRGENGILYRSVRDQTDMLANCVACFRPPLVTNVRPGFLVTLRTGQYDEWTVDERKQPGAAAVEPH